MGKRVELLVMVALAIAIFIIVVIVFLDLQKGVRDSKRRADIGVIANSLEIHYNSKTNEYCPDASVASYCHPQFTWFSGGVPLDPLRGDYINLPKNGDKKFLICAKLERGGGNSASSSGNPASLGNADYFCQQNQQ